MLQHPRDMRANNRPPLGLGKPATKSIKSSTRGIGKPRGRRTDDAIAEASAKKLRETLRQAEAKQTASWVRAQHQVCLHRGLLSNFLQHFFRETYIAIITVPRQPLRYNTGLAQESAGAGGVFFRDLCTHYACRICLDSCSLSCSPSDACDHADNLNTFWDRASSLLKCQ